MRGTGGGLRHRNKDVGLNKLISTYDLKFVACFCVVCFASHRDSREKRSDRFDRLSILTNYSSHIWLSEGDTEFCLGIRSDGLNVDFLGIIDQRTDDPKNKLSYIGLPDCFCLSHVNPVIRAFDSICHEKI